MAELNGPLEAGGEGEGVAQGLHYRGGILWDEQEREELFVCWEEMDHVCSGSAETEAM